MRQLVSACLLVLFLYHLIGYYPVSAWQRQQFRTAADARRHTASPAGLTRLTVARTPAAQARLHWQTADEFRYGGKLYDVLFRHRTADAVSYWCWRDVGEERLLAGVAEHVRDFAYPDAAASKAAKKLFQFLAKIVFTATATVLPTAYLTTGHPQYAAFSPSTAGTGNDDELFQPPRGA